MSCHRAADRSAGWVAVDVASLSRVVASYTEPVATTIRRPLGDALALELHDAVEPLAPEWEELAARSGAMPFVRPGWMAAWYEAFGRGRPRVAALRADGRLAAVAALEESHGVLRSAANWHTPGYDVVAESDAAALQLASAVVALRPRRLELRFVEPDGLALPAFRSAAAAAGYRILTRRLQESPYLPIDRDWDEYCDSVSTRMLKELDRRWRSLERTGAVALSFPSGDEVDDALAEGVALEGSGWKGRNGTAIASRPETHRFYTDVAAWAAERGWLRLAFLRHEGRGIAFQFDVEADGVVYHLKPGYDESYGRVRPGKLLMREVLRRSFESGAGRYEFLGGPDPHKLEWTDRLRGLQQLQAFAPTPAGLGDLAANRYARPVARRTLAALARVRGVAR
jgi:CelD/BcsL family acetyltransferase involved in cellulose biosynthesis